MDSLLARSKNPTLRRCSTHLVLVAETLYPIRFFRRHGTPCASTVPKISAALGAAICNSWNLCPPFYRLPFCSYCLLLPILQSCLDSVGGGMEVWSIRAAQLLLFFFLLSERHESCAALGEEGELDFPWVVSRKRSWWFWFKWNSG